MLKTPLADSWYLNGGTSTIGSKAQERSFYTDEFSSSQITGYEHGLCLINDCKSLSMVQTEDLDMSLLKYKRRNCTTSATIVTGRVVVMSRKLKPL